MTVITKPISENKVEKPVEKTLMTCVDGDKGKQQCVNVGVDMRTCDGSVLHPGVVDDCDLWSWTSSSGGGLGGRSAVRRRRLSATTTVCVFVGTLLFITVGIIGSVYIYRQCTISQMTRFRGWCGVPFRRSALRINGYSPFMKGSASHWPSSSSDGIFNEQFDLDLGTEEHEKIFVPDFGYGRNGSFIHDFKKKMTSIVDDKSQRCFVFPLDPGLVAPPKKMFHILRKMMNSDAGFYNGNMLVIRQTLRVIRPPLQDISTTGVHIEKMCTNYKTYRLEKIIELRPRRSSEDAIQQSDSHFTIAEFAGEAIVQYTIIDE